MGDREVLHTRVGVHPRARGRGATPHTAHQTRRALRRDALPPVLLLLMLH
eukprot:COSAG03_NODE_11166_length_608_cov_1.239686_1_plen_49_part_10